MKIQIGPQPGPQTQFISTEADIAIYGGAAGSGKTYCLLLEPLRHYGNPRFGSVIFRRNTTQVRNEGGLWDESMSLYGALGMKPYESSLYWEAPTGWRMKFAHLEYDKTVLDWQGAQIAYIGFDELTHFSEHQFFYMLSRNRSTSGVAGYVRATCNPDSDSWVRSFIDWWIDPYGYAIPERSGKLRYFMRINEELIWADTKQELYDKYGSGAEVQPKSLTFIPAKLEDNQILMQKDPSYLANLLALNRVDRLRLKEGNWNIRPSAGNFFKREWFPLVDAIPGGWISSIRFWDRASSKPSSMHKDPDWTRGLKLYRYSDGTYCIADLKSTRDTPYHVERLIKNVAQHDGFGVTIMSQQDPGSAGVAEGEHFIKMLAGHIAKVEPFFRDKVTRAKPVSAQVEAGNIKVLRAPWNDEFFSELENFPEGLHDDIVDCLSGAFNAVSQKVSTVQAMWGAFYAGKSNTETK